MFGGAFHLEPHMPKWNFAKFRSPYYDTIFLFEAHDEWYFFITIFTPLKNALFYCTPQYAQCKKNWMGGLLRIHFLNPFRHILRYHNKIGIQLLFLFPRIIVQWLNWKKLETNSLVVGCRLIYSKHSTRSGARNKNILFFNEGRVPIEILSPMHHSSTVAIRKNIFSRWGLVPIEFFLVYPCTMFMKYIRQKRKYFFSARVDCRLNISNFDVARNKNIFLRWGLHTR